MNESACKYCGFISGRESDEDCPAKPRGGRMKVTIEVIDNAWVVRRGKTAKVFYMWHMLEAYLRALLTLEREGN